MTYHPEPLDTADIALPASLTALEELLARHVHDVWGSQRIAEGWSYGMKRDDDKRTHPGLVPYEQLSESEKEYDRGTARETLKAIVAAGWQLVPSSD